MGVEQCSASWWRSVLAATCGMQSPAGDKPQVGCGRQPVRSCCSQKPSQTHGSKKTPIRIDIGPQYRS